MPKLQALALYMPVLHRGYIDFFTSHAGINTAYIFGQDILDSLDYIRKDLRALTPKQQAEVLSRLGIFKKIEILSLPDIRKADDQTVEFIMPDEDISREVAARIKNARVKFYPIFLRWDRRSVQGASKLVTNIKISSSKKASDLLQAAADVSAKSSDIWRYVGAVIKTKTGRLVGPAANQAEPSTHTPWIEGDPRNAFNRGIGIEMSIFTHAEAALIAGAAKEGIKLDGAEIYVTVFPCPACAKLIAHSGIKKCYFAEGYAVLDGARVMQEYGVELIHVPQATQDSDKARTVPYEKS